MFLRSTFCMNLLHEPFAWPNKPFFKICQVFRLNQFCFICVCLCRQCLRKTTAQCRVLFLTVLLPIVIGLVSGTDAKWYFFLFPCVRFSLHNGPKLAKLILFKPDCKVLRWFWFLLKTCIWKWWRTDYSLWRFWPPSFASEYHQPSSCSKVSVHIVAFTKIWIFCVRSMWCWCAYWHW